MINFFVVWLGGVWVLELVFLLVVDLLSMIYFLD